MFPDWKAVHIMFMDALSENNGISKKFFAENFDFRQLVYFTHELTSKLAPYLA